ncbi:MULTISPECIES: hypothetical protein [unclassified Amycolatopsis]|nr:MULTISPECIES: hypothetical protein [unclassified Amycolatopsis]
MSALPLVDRSSELLGGGNGRFVVGRAGDFVAVLDGDEVAAAG